MSLIQDLGQLYFSLITNNGDAIILHFTKLRKGIIGFTFLDLKVFQASEKSVRVPTLTQASLIFVTFNLNMH